MLDVLTEHFDEFASGLWVTTRLVLASFVIALVLGTLVAALRVAPGRWPQRLGALYVEVFRNLPLLVLLFITFAGLRRAGVGIGPWTAGIASLGIYTSAYVAEALRSGVFAVSRGQREAALSLGFTELQVLREIVLPQAFRTVIPPLGSIANDSMPSMTTGSELPSIFRSPSLRWTGRRCVRMRSCCASEYPIE